MEKVPRGAGKREIKRISLLRATTQENSGIPRARGHCFILCQQFSHQERPPLTISPQTCPNQHLLRQTAPTFMKGNGWLKCFVQGTGEYEGGKSCVVMARYSILNYWMRHLRLENYLQFNLQKVSVTLGSHRHLLPSPLPSNHVLKALGKKICLLPTQLICITHSWK